jgi:hypothetical protein
MENLDWLSCGLSLLSLFLFFIALLRPTFAAPITLIVIGAVLGGIAILIELIGFLSKKL